MYLIRLDDASEYMDNNKWNRILYILDKYNIKPIIGIIPENKDENLCSRYSKNDLFWVITNEWIKKGYCLAMHGYQHVFITSSAGINPINNYSEFAGLNLKIQEERIEKGYKILLEKGINPLIFFAPAHTFDDNTLLAIRNKTSIRIISDTISSNIYYNKGFHFIPQQSGNVRKLKLKVVTFCYHPNNMNDKDFTDLENFIKVNLKKFVSVDDLDFSKKKKLSAWDLLIRKIYFIRRRFK